MNWVNIIRKQIEKVDNLERSALLNKTNAVRKNVIPFLVTYSPTLPNIREIINKHWHILNINNTFGNVFKPTSVIAFRKNTSLRQIIGYNQKLLKVKQNVTKGECIPCNTSRCLSCQQIIATTTFESIQTKEKFNIYNKTSCKSKYIIYLLMSALQNIVCQKVRNSFSHKTEQPQKGYKTSSRYRSMQRL